MNKRTARRQSRYGHLCRGWDWRTTVERLTKMEARRQALGLSKTEYLERCVDIELAQIVEKESDHE